jgi:hypothetical protein
MLIIPLALLFLAGGAAASSICAQVGLDQYVSNNSGLGNACYIGDKLFYNFTYTVNVGPGPSAGQITVAPDPGDGLTSPGLIFSSGSLRVFAGGAMDVTIQYDVLTVSGSAVIDDYLLSMAGAHTQTLGLGVGSVTESFSNAPTMVTQVGPGTFSVSTQHESFSPWVSGTHVTTEVSLTSPAGSGDVVTVSAVQEHFSEEIPEPYQAVLIGSGLLLLGLWRRRVA